MATHTEKEIEAMGSAIIHTAIGTNTEKRLVNWMESVTDKEYNEG